MLHITEEQANILKGREYTPDNKYNPIQDENGDWFISEEEQMYLTKKDTDLQFTKNLEEKQFVEKTNADEITKADILKTDIKIKK